MTGERRQTDSAAASEELVEIFSWALELPAEERDRRLAQRVDDPELLQQVRALLAADERPAETISGIVARAADEAIGPGAPLERLGSYQLVEEIGRGGMGTVYLATRTVDDFAQRVAIKVVREELLGPDLAQRLRSERQILSRFEHPNIARLLDGGTTPAGSPYLVMEFVEGVSIDRYCDEHELGVEERLQLFCIVCDAVHAAHRSLVVHRDLKPSNILVDRHGQPKLLDFGIAKLVAEDDATGAAPTRTLLQALTPDYASPEQVRGEAVTTASDVYSLGAVLYELLSGRRPYEVSGSSPVEIERIVCDTDPPPPSTVSGVGERRGGRRQRAPRLRGDLDNIVLKALAKEPDRRYASAFELAEDLRRHLRGLPVSARPDTLAYRTSKFVRRHRAAVLVASVLVLALVGFSLTTAVQSWRVARQRDLAEGERAKAETVVDLLIDVFESSDSTENSGLELTAREILERGQARLEELDDVPAVRSAAAGALGKVYRNLGEYDTSLELFEQALEDSRREYGERSLPTATAYAELGRLDRMRGEYEQAGRFLRHALEMHRELLGEEHPQVADDLNNLAVVYVNQNRIDEAEHLYLEALAQRRKLLGEGHRATATTLANLGDLYHERGDYERARDTLSEALAATRQAVGDLHLDTAISLNNLAVTLERLGDYERARRDYRESLEIREQLLPAGHPLILKARGNLATLLLRQGHHEEAGRELARVVSELRERGEGGLDLAAPLSNYGLALREAGRLSAAIAALEEAAAEIAAELGDEHPMIAYPLHNLALTYERKGNDSGAERLYRRALELRQNGYESPHPDVAFSLDALGSFLLARDRLSEAVPLLEEALAQRRRIFETSAEPVVESLLMLSLARYEAEEPAAARALAGEAVTALAAGGGASRAPAAGQALNLVKARCLAGEADGPSACLDLAGRLAPDEREPSRLEASWKSWAERLALP